jgi:hypothetical protein
MLKENKYSKIYFSIIRNAQDRVTVGYIERHHIIPRCLGGLDDSSNIVALTAREHFICHLLLIKMVDGSLKHKMVFAAWQQSRPSKHKSFKITGRTYEMLRRQLSESMTGRKRPQFSEEWRANMSKRAQGEKNNMFNKRHTIDSLKKMSDNRKDKCVGKDNPFFGKTHSDEFKQLQAERARARMTGVPKLRVSCIYCRKEVSHNMINRHHGDNCKLKP